MDFRRVRMAAVLGILSLFLLGLVYIGSLSASEEAPCVLINEISVQKRTAITIGTTACDWVELYNPGSTDISLNGWTLTDDPENPNQYLFSTETVIPAGSYLVVYCNAALPAEERPPCTALFSLSAGECVCLTHLGSLQAESVVVPENLPISCTWARAEDGEFRTAHATPESSNSYPEAPVFSVLSGFYPDAFDLELTAPKASQIWYTLDSSDPRTSDTRILYTDLIHVEDVSLQDNVLNAVPPKTYTTDKSKLPTDAVDKAMVVRACALDAQGHWSDCASSVYFIGDTFQKYENLSVVSLVTDYSNLFDPDSGIYVYGTSYTEDSTQTPNMKQRGLEWERSGALTVLDSEHNVEINQNVALRINGGYSRDNSRKSFRVLPTDTEGFQSALFKDNITVSGKTVDCYQSLLLRCGGNMRLSTVYDDAWLQTMGRELNMYTSRFRPVLLFLNGELWGFYVLQTDTSESNLAARLEVSSESINAVYRNDLDSVSQEGFPDFWDMIYYIRNHDMANDICYAKACELLDMESLADYLAFQYYISNTDWPHNNYAFYRCKAEYAGAQTDTRWKLICYDTDLSLQRGTLRETEYDANRYSETITQLMPCTNLFRALLVNQQFRELYRASTEKVADIFEAESSSRSYRETIEGLAPYYTIARTANVSCHSEKSIRNRIENVCTFLEKRNDYHSAYTEELLRAAEKDLDAYLQKAAPLADVKE